MNRCCKRNRGVTLLELLLAVLLLSLVGMAAVVSEMLGERALRLTRDRSIAQREAQLLMEHLFSRLLVAGSLQVVNAQEVIASIDYDMNWQPLNTPDTAGDDTWIRYRLIGTDVWFEHDVSPVFATPVSTTVARAVTALTMALSDQPSILQVDVVTQSAAESVDLHSSIALRCMAAG